MKLQKIIKAIVKICPQKFYCHHGQLFQLTGGRSYDDGSPEPADPLNDLNIIYILEECLDKWEMLHYDRDLSKYEYSSDDVNFYTWHIKPALKLEAFLKIKGMWVEEEE